MAQTVTLHDMPLDEPMFLADVLNRVKYFEHLYKCDVYCNGREPAELPAGRTYHRDPVGWIEWLIVMEFEGGGKLTVGAIQRAVDAVTEFHS